MSNKLFVGNLSFNTTENDLQDAFAVFGTVTEANLMMDRATGRARGFGFVTMSTPDEAQKAIAGMNGKSIDGRALTVNLAKPREERSGGGGGGRRQYGGGGGGRDRYWFLRLNDVPSSGSPGLDSFCTAVAAAISGELNGSVAFAHAKTKTFGPRNH
jgi:cold-inducible RNA-binding protein